MESKSAKKLMKYLKASNVEITPIVDEVLTEFDRLAVIRDRLYEQIEKGPLLEIYINKSGNENEVIAAAIKEYKSYSNQFNNIVKTIQLIVGSKGDKGDENDPLKKILSR